MRYLIQRWQRKGVFVAMKGNEMEDQGKPKRWIRRSVGILSTVAVSLSLMALGPATAQAATFKQSISGKVTAPKGVKVGNQQVKTTGGYNTRAGNITAYKGNKSCDYLEEGVDYEVDWKGSNFTVSFKKAGKYKIRYDDYAHAFEWNNAAKIPTSIPFGVASTYHGKDSYDCKSAKAITLKSGQKVTKKNISAKALGAIEVIGTSLKYTSKISESLMVINTKSNLRWGTMQGKPVSSSSKVYKPTNPTTMIVPPGKYKIAKTRYQTQAYDLYSNTITQVFGAGKSKSVKKGKTITVKAGKSARVNFKKNQVKAGKKFSSKATVSLKGSGAAGKTLTASTKSFPKGTKFKFEWTSDWKDIKKATKKKYKVKSTDRAAYIEVRVTATKPGYVSQTFWDGVTIKGTKLKSKGKQTVSGNTLKKSSSSEWYDYTIDAGNTITAKKMSFSQKGVASSFYWYSDSGRNVDGNKFVTDSSDSGTIIYLSGNYTKKYHEPFYSSLAILVN